MAGAPSVVAIVAEVYVKLATCHRRVQIRGVDDVAIEIDDRAAEAASLTGVTDRVVGLVGDGGVVGQHVDVDAVGPRARCVVVGGDRRVVDLSHVIGTGRGWPCAIAVADGVREGVGDR